MGIFREDLHDISFAYGNGRVSYHATTVTSRLPALVRTDVVPQPQPVGCPVNTLVGPWVPLPDAIESWHVWLLATS